MDETAIQTITSIAAIHEACRVALKAHHHGHASGLLRTSDEHYHGMPEGEAAGADQHERVHERIEAVFRVTRRHSRPDLMCKIDERYHWLSQGEAGGADQHMRVHEGSERAFRNVLKDRSALCLCGQMMDATTACQKERREGLTSTSMSMRGSRKFSGMSSKAHQAWCDGDK